MQGISLDLSSLGQETVIKMFTWCLCRWGLFSYHGDAQLKVSRCELRNINISVLLWLQVVRARCSDSSI